MSVGTRVAESEPFRVSFTGCGIEITAKLTTPDVADDLIQAVSALKLLLRPTDFVKWPEPREESAEQEHEQIS